MFELGVPKEQIRFLQPDVSAANLARLRAFVSLNHPSAIMDPGLQAYLIIDGTHRSYLELVESGKDGLVLDVFEDPLHLDGVVTGSVRNQVQRYLHRAASNPEHYLRFPTADGLVVH